MTDDLTVQVLILSHIEVHNDSGVIEFLWLSIILVLYKT